MNYRAAKKKQKNKTPENPEDTFRKIRLPRRNEGEMFAKATQRLGGNQMRAFCEDGIERLIRIPGKLRKRVWIRDNDIIIVKLWDFQPIKGDVIWRYQGFQVNWLEKNNHLKQLYEKLSNQ